MRMLLSFKFQTTWFLFDPFSFAVKSCLVFIIYFIKFRYLQSNIKSRGLLILNFIFINWWIKRGLEINVTIKKQFLSAVATINMLVEIPLMISFRSAPNLVISSIFKQTILFYAECSLKMARYTKFLPITLKKTQYCTQQASNMAMILLSNPMFIFSTNLHVVEHER